MLDRTGFDQWADEYNKTVRLSNEENTYPFGDKWDDEEIYFVVDELQKTFPALVFHQISYCAGILSLTI